MRKLACFALPFCLAVFGVRYLLPAAAVLPMGLLCGVLVPLCLWLAPKGPRRLRAMLTLAGVCLGLLWCVGYDRLVCAPAEAAADTTIRLEATVTGWPMESDYGFSVLVRADIGGLIPVSTVLYGDEAYAALRPGDRISTVAGCRLAAYRHGEEVTYYTAKGVFLTASGYGDLTVERPEIPPLFCRPALLTRALQDGISTVFAPAEGALVKALVTGDKTGLDDSLSSQLRRDGLSHVIVVSGMHLSILVSVVVLLMGPNRKRSAVAGVLLILLVIVLAGTTPSVVRAGILQLSLLIAPILGRRSDSLTSLSLALMLLLLANPYAAANIGLQLSFGAVLGLELFSGPLRAVLLDKLSIHRSQALPARCWNALLYPLSAALSATLAAQVFTLPLCAWYFGSISLIAPLTNVLVILAISPVFCGGLLAGGLNCILPVLGRAVASITTPLVRYILFMVDRLAQSPFASLTTSSGYYIAWLFLVYLLLGLSLLWRGPRRWLTPVCCGVVTLGAAILFTSLSFQAGNLTVSVLDVGQGESILLRSGSYLALVDCGGDSLDNPGDVAADALSDVGRSRLDLLVLTHFHTDHANGIPQLLNRVEVGVLAIPDVDPGSPLRQVILSEAQASGTEVWFIDSDYTVTLEDGTVFQLYAPLAVGETNEEGLTVLCSAGDFDVLITGDMNSDVEQLLLDHADLPDIELLVVGHHGSKYSTSEQLLAQTRPELAVISVGGGNQYGHPTQETLSRLENAGAEIYRTDQNGTVTIHAADLTQ